MRIINVLKFLSRKLRYCSIYLELDCYAKRKQSCYYKTNNERGIGKTTALVKLAKKYNGIFVAENKTQAMYAERKFRMDNLPRIISNTEYQIIMLRLSGTRDEIFFIDETVNMRTFIDNLKLNGLDTDRCTFIHIVN